MKISDFGKKLTAKTGILQLMDDIGRPLPEGIPSYRLGGGNPARIPEVEAVFRNQMQNMLSDGDTFEKTLGLYDSPQGKQSFLENLANLFCTEYGWNITSDNIMLTSGSQSAAFYLFNLFSGTKTDDTGKQITQKILFPLVPEYIGYADQGVEAGTFASIPPKCEYYDDNTFKYFIDFDVLEDYLANHNDVGAMCVSRPTNPTGNVLTNEEIKHLDTLAGKYDIPLFIDNAYGMPFPHIVFTDEASPMHSDNFILGMSLSKIGLPSLRTGIIIAKKEIIELLSSINAIAALAPTGFGPALINSIVENKEILTIAEGIVKPYYEEKSINTQKWIHELFADTNYFVHKSEGALFLWIYLPDLKITTMQLYADLKERGVITVPGEYFFFGMEDGKTSEHFDKCLRINYSCDKDEVYGGLKIIAEEYKKNS